MIVVLKPFATIELKAAVIVDVTALAGPGVNATISLSVIGFPSIVPVIVALPAVTDDVKVAVYVPSPLSVTEDNVPEVVDNKTIAPPVVKLVPMPFLACTVIIVVELPFATIEFEAAVMAEVVGSAEVLIKLTVASSVIGDPLRVPVMVAVAGEADDVSVAV